MAARDVDLVLFEAGGRRWAADAWDVVRVARRQAKGASAFLVPSDGVRVLVVRGEAGEVQVPIDRLLGFERVSANTLRPMPAFAQQLTSPAVVGAWLSPREIVLLIDLLALVKQSASRT